MHSFSQVIFSQGGVLFLNMTRIKKNNGIMNGRMFSVSISFQRLKMLDEIIMCKMENFGYNTHPYMSSIRLWISLWKAFFYFLLHQTATEHRFKKQFYVAVVVVVFCWMEVLMGNKCYDRNLKWANFLHFYEIIWQTNQQTSSQTTNRETNGRTWGVIGWLYFRKLDL